MKIVTWCYWQRICCTKDVSMAVLFLSASHAFIPLTLVFISEISVMTWLQTLKLYVQCSFKAKVQQDKL